MKNLIIALSVLAAVLTVQSMAFAGDCCSKAAPCCATSEACCK